MNLLLILVGMSQNFKNSIVTELGIITDKLTLEIEQLSNHYMKISKSLIRITDLQ